MSDRVPETDKAEDTPQRETVAEKSLDFTSPTFDPLSALYSEHVNVPIPDAALLDNVAKCRTILPPELPESLANQQTVAKGNQVSSNFGAEGFMYHVFMLACCKQFVPICQLSTFPCLCLLI